MMNAPRVEQHLRTFLTILKEYQLDMPLAKFLQAYFRGNKQMGSSDRRVAGNLLYTYFRLGRACLSLAPHERLFLALFLCDGEDNASPNGVSGRDFLAHFKPELNEMTGLELEEKISFLEKGETGFKLKDVFPFYTHLSKGIDKEAFLRSFFVQPDLFIRLNPKLATFVKAKLDGAGIAWKAEGENTLRLPNGTKLDQVFPGAADDYLFEIQDLSSQRTGELYKPVKYDYWWDACAGSGGKSLLLYQQQPEIRLMVSDMRETILDNLGERFAKAGLHKFQKKQLDLTKNPDPDIHHYEFDGILLDIPCSGSGTWGRTPEMISQFQDSSVSNFQKLQQSIASNVTKYLKPGKPLIYMTCSVFREENEEMIEFLCSKFGLKVEEGGVLKGYDNRSDTMYGVRLVGVAPGP